MVDSSTLLAAAAGGLGGLPLAPGVPAQASAIDAAQSDALTVALLAGTPGGAPPQIDLNGMLNEALRSMAPETMMPEFNLGNLDPSLFSMPPASALPELDLNRLLDPAQLANIFTGNDPSLAGMSMLGGPVGSGGNSPLGLLGNPLQQGTPPLLPPVLPGPREPVLPGTVGGVDGLISALLYGNPPDTNPPTPFNSPLLEGLLYGRIAGNGLT